MQIRKLRLREVMGLVHSHNTAKGRGETRIHRVWLKNLDSSPVPILFFPNVFPKVFYFKL